MKSVSNSLVSIVIPAFNAERHIRHAIDSALSQSYPHIEVIVIDDGSTDETRAIVARYNNDERVSILSHEKGQNLGVSRTRQAGVDHARGKYIAFLDADDLFVATKIETQVGILEDNREAVLCHSAISAISEVEGGPDFEKSFNWSAQIENYHHEKMPFFMKKNRICNSSVLVRAEPLRSISFSSHQLFQYEDWLTWILLADKGPFIYLPEKLISYRYHCDSASYGVINRPLAKIYSNLELYLCVMAKSSSYGIKYRALKEIKNTLMALYKTYRG